LKVNVAVVGLGKMGLSHVSIINALPEFNLIGVCDSSRLVTSVLSGVTGLKSFTSYDLLLQTEGLQAILIATPTIAHEGMVRKALERGLHVFAEKPLTLDATASRDLATLASEKSLVTQVGYHNRFIATFGEAARLLGAGALGKVTHVLGESYGPVVLRPTKGTWRSKSGQGGGCLHDYAAHTINLLNWYFGRVTHCIGASLRRGYSAEVEDQTSALLEFADGTVGQLSVNWSDPSVRKMTTRVSVWGQGGKIQVDRQELQLFLSGDRPIPEGYCEGWNLRYITDLTPPVSFYLRGEEYSAQLESFGRAILAKNTKSVNSFAAAAETDEAIELILARNGEGHSTTDTLRPVTQKSLLDRLLGR
jgi:scyllo-inositol 2-dehydrogenase (NADP+)